MKEIKRKDWVEIADIKLSEDFPPDSIMIERYHGDTRISIWRDGHYQGEITINSVGTIIENDT